MATRPIAADILDSRRDDWTITDDGVNRGKVTTWPAPVLSPYDTTPAMGPASKLTRSGLPDAYAFLRGRLDAPKLSWEDFPDRDLPNVPMADAMGIPQYRAVPKPPTSFAYDVPGVDRYEAGMVMGGADAAMLVNFLRRTDAGALDAWSGFSGQECRMLLDEAGALSTAEYTLAKKLYDQCLEEKKHSPRVKVGFGYQERQCKPPEAYRSGGDGGLFGVVGKAIGSAATTVGSGVASVAKGIATPVAALATSPLKLASDIASGKNVFQSLKDTVKRDLSSAKELAPYVQAVISVVPGVGQGVNAAIAAGAALAQGQPITSALISGLKGALPGGPVAAQAFDTVYAVARGQNLGEAALQALVNNAPGGEVGKQAAQAAIAVAKGQNLQQAAIAAAKGATLKLLPGGSPAIVKDIATKVASGDNVLGAVKTAVGSQVMANFSPVARGVLDNVGPRVGGSLGAVLPTLLPIEARMVAQTLLQNPSLRSMKVEDLARKMGVSTHTIRDGMGAVIQAAQKSGGASVPSLSQARDVASRIPIGASFDNALASLGSKSAPKTYNHNVASPASAAARLRRTGSIFQALSARGLDAGALDPKTMPTIRRGSKGEPVKAWQKIINVVADGDFGPNTEAATKVFQTKNKLVADGIVGEKTWLAGIVNVASTTPVTIPGTSIPMSVPPPATTAPIIAANMPVIRKGSTGAAVKTWQMYLNLTADGIFGPQTENATKAFQTKNGLVADGVVGKNTWGKAMGGTASSPPVITIPGLPPVSLPPVVTSPPMPTNPPGQPPPPPPITTTPPGTPPVVMPPPTTTGGGSGLLVGGAVILGGLLLMGMGSRKKIA